MRLHEEYIRRCELDIPIIRYDRRSNLFLKTTSVPFRWAIFNIVWRPQHNSPNVFEFTRMEPVHNGLGAFHCQDTDRLVYWERYENEVCRIINDYKETGFQPVSNRYRSLMAWEMFLFMFDGWLAERMSPKFYQYVEKSITDTLDIHSRVAAFRSANKILIDSYESERVVEMLTYQILPMANGHSQWLEDLINA